MPEFFRKDLGFGTPDDVAGLVVYLASAESDGITGQAIGAGGDRIQLWSHPEAVLTELHDGGWSADAVAADLAPVLRAHLQGVGEDFPALPPEHVRAAE
jgi:3-oxoacyl-[acyl-carrier protein] reductase